MSNRDDAERYPTRADATPIMRDALQSLIDWTEDVNYGPNANVNLRLVLKGLGTVHSSDDEICHATGLDKAELELYREVIDEGKAQGKVGIRRMQMRVAMNGNPSMLKHVGRHILGQIDSAELAKANPLGSIEDAEVVSTDSPKERLKGKLQMMSDRLKAKQKPKVTALMQIAAPVQSPETETSGNKD